MNLKIYIYMFVSSYSLIAKFIKSYILASDYIYGIYNYKN